MKIINMKRFITFIFAIILLILVFSLIFNNKVLSKTKLEYVDYIIGTNDTLWSIALEIKEKNINYENKDVREIIYEIKKLNNMDNSDIFFMDSIQIPKN